MKKSIIILSAIMLIFLTGCFAPKTMEDFVKYGKIESQVETAMLVECSKPNSPFQSFDFSVKENTLTYEYYLVPDIELTSSQEFYIKSSFTASILSYIEGIKKESGIQDTITLKMIVYYADNTVFYEHSEDL